LRALGWVVATLPPAANPKTQCFSKEEGFKMGTSFRSPVWKPEIQKKKVDQPTPIYSKLGNFWGFIFHHPLYIKTRCTTSVPKPVNFQLVIQIQLLNLEFVFMPGSFILFFI
jgi:hypothetical protein